MKKKSSFIEALRMGLENMGVRLPKFDIIPPGDNTNQNNKHNNRHKYQNQKTNRKKY